MPRTALYKPPYLRGQIVAASPTLTAAREELRLAERELELWESAFDRQREGNPDEYHVEIRVAEDRLRAARISENRLTAPL
jgi:hypothetical protein